MERLQSALDISTANRYIETLAAELDAQGGTTAYMQYIEGRYQGQLTYKTIITNAHWAYPRELAGETSDAERQAFWRGGLLGMRVAEEYLGEESLLRLNNESNTASGDTADEESSELSKRARAEDLKTIGDAGYSLAYPYHHWLACATIGLNGSGSEELALNRGFGLAIAWLNQIVGKDAIRGVFQRTNSDEGLDWDEAFVQELELPQDGKEDSSL